ncbi:hypothetical protein Cgig2_025388 [Carnegiea gigantea]|uniref:Uncharacterized protein n=1 Tax=Carnegiea gigantea TaxID=171969 RepID=A0A9Q1JJ06_9CARY|nr:hypothetical protein Cgig2_025388 [Carnegiea gigantea]
MLLNEVERLGVLYVRTLHIMELALTELRWGTFESWVWLNEDRIFKARFREKDECEEENSDAKRDASSSDHDKQENMRERKKERDQHAALIMAFPPLHDTREMADFVRESFRWHWRRATRSPRLLPDDYQDLCPRFSLSKVKRAVLNLELPEMV